LKGTNSSGATGQNSYRKRYTPVLVGSKEEKKETLGNVGIVTVIYIYQNGKAFIDHRNMGNSIQLSPPRRLHHVATWLAQ
jgi:hypothetical protein